MKIKKIIFTAVTLLFATCAFAGGPTFSFAPLSNYCDTHDCSILPEKIAPKTVIVIHGMNSSMDSSSNGKQLNGTYVRLLSFLTGLGKGDPNYHVYGVDYNSKGIHPGSQPIKLVALTGDSSCSAKGGWQHCWKTIEQSDNTYTPFNITIRNVSTEVRNLLIKAADDGYIAKSSMQDGKLINPVTLVEHSMGGLVARDLLYHGDGNITGYEILKDHGVWINEYVSLGTPHNHGFFGIDNQKMIGITQGSNCLGLQPIFQKASLQAYQFCMLEQWDKAVNSGDYHWKNKTPISISKVDFPQIHWVFVSGLGEPLPLDQSKGDGLVDYRSAQYQLYPGDTTKRADNNVYLNEYLDSGNILPFLDTHIGINGIPGQRGTLASDGGVMPYSGFAENSNVVHSSLVNVGYYYGGDIKNVDDLKQCSFTGNLDYGIAACIGYFQYVIPNTSLCELPGYNKDAAYFKRNPQFFPDNGLANFDKVCNY